MEDYLVRDTFDEIRAKSRFLLKEKKEEYISNTNLDLQQFAIEVNLVIQ